MAKTRFSFDRFEDRRDRRMARPPVAVTLAGVQYVSVDWSLGGIRLLGFREVPDTGALLAGTLALEAAIDEKVDFVGEVVRTDIEYGEVALRFVSLSEAAFDLLDRGIARQFRPRR